VSLISHRFPDITVLFSSMSTVCVDHQSDR